MKRLTIAAALLLAACQPASTDAAKPAETAAETKPAATTEAKAPEAAPVTPAKPSGPPATLKAETEDNPAAYVTDVVGLKNSDAKIFSTAGGDPAINGLYTYLAVYQVDEPGGGWTVFQIGDFNEWKVIEDTAEKVVLEVSRSWVEQKSGEIKTAVEKLIVAVPASGATSTTVTPAT